MYGTLVGKIAVTCEDGKQVLVDWINPFALIAHACAASLGFFRTMQAAMQHAHQEHGGQLRFVLYHDGVTPGNNLRPDCGRAFVSFLWSWLDLPLWLRSREHLRWITCSYVEKSMMKKHKFTVMH